MVGRERGHEWIGCRGSKKERSGELGFERVLNEMCTSYALGASRSPSSALSLKEFRVTVITGTGGVSLIAGLGRNQSLLIMLAAAA